MKLRIALLSLLALCLAVVPAVAQTDIYDNGPTNGTTDAWTINFGFAVSNSFTVGDSNITGMTFAAWLSPGDVLQSAEVLIGTSAFAGDIFDSTVNFTQSDCVSNQYGFNVCNETGNFNASVSAGTYWVTLQNASVNTGDPVYWDENSGPSSAMENELGTVPSESFTLFGGGTTSTTSTTSTTTTTSTTPEPSSIMLLGSGILGLAGVVRRKLSR